MPACCPSVHKRGPENCNADGKYGPVDSNNRNESLHDVFSANTFLQLCPWFCCADILMVTGVIVCFSTVCRGRSSGEEGEPLSVVGQDNISLPRPACLQGSKPVFFTHLQGMKSEECTPNLHPLLSLQRNIDGGPFMEPDQDLQAPRRSVFHVCLYHLTLGSFSCFCAQTVHSGRIHNAVKLPEGDSGPGRGPW